MTEKTSIAATGAEPQKEEYGKSKGERLFDWLTYGGIAGVGVFLVNIPSTYWAKYGGGAKWFSQATTWLEKKGMSAGVAEDIMMTHALGIVGHLAVIPIKVIENNKPKIVEKFNVLLGEKDDIADIRKEPKQTWSSLVKSRLMAWSACFLGLRGAAMFMPKQFETFENGFAKTTCKVMGKASHIAGQETKWFRYGKIAALDGFATAAAASLLYVGSRMFAKEEKEEEDKQAKAPVAKTPPPSATAKNTKHADSVKPCAPCMLAQRFKYKSMGEKVAAQRQEAAEQSMSMAV